MHHTYTLAVQLGRLSLDDLGENLKQAGDFGLGPVPVLGRKSVKGQILYTHCYASSKNSTDIFCAGFVPGQAGQSSLTRPTTVSVHDYGDVSWNPHIAVRRFGSFYDQTPSSQIASLRVVAYLQPLTGITVYDKPTPTGQTCSRLHYLFLFGAAG
jgi:hypothetical protein